MMNREVSSQFERMTQSPILPLVVTLSIPTIISMMVTNIYNMVDTLFVSQLGTSASGAVGIVFGFMAILQAFGFMFGQGCGSMIARMLGRQEKDTATATASMGFFGSLGLGIVIGIIGWIFIDPLVNFLGSTPTIAPYAKIYISYILISAPFTMASYTMNNILRFEGKANLGMIGLVLGSILNMAGDPILMFGLHMGIAGAGLSTAISQSVSFFVLLWMFLSGRTQCKLRITSIRPHIRSYPELCATGFSSLLRQGLSSITTVLLNSKAGVYSDAAVAAMSIVSRIGMFIFSIAVGIGQGFQPVCGFNYGAKKYDRVRKGFYITFVLAEVLMGIMALIVIIFSGGLIAVFRNDPEVIVIGTRALRLHALALFFLPICMTVEMMLQSSGKKLGASILTATRGGIIFIPSIYIFVGLRGLAGVQEAQPFSYVISAVISIFFAVNYFKKLPRE